MPGGPVIHGEETAAAPWSLRNTDVPAAVFHWPAEAGQYLFVVLFLGSLFPRCGSQAASCLESTHRLLQCGYLPAPPYMSLPTPLSLLLCPHPAAAGCPPLARLQRLTGWPRCTCGSHASWSQHQVRTRAATSTTMAYTHLPRTATVKPHHTPAHLPMSALLPCPRTLPDHPPPPHQPVRC